MALNMSGRAVLSSACVAGMLCALVPRTASAYVREVTSAGVPVWWRNPCVTMQLFLGDPPPVLAADQFLRAARAAASVWSQPALACADLRLSVVPDARATGDVGFDKQNVVVFRREIWCAGSSPSADPSTSVCYDPAAIAVTTIFKNTTTGEILEADIAFNAVDYAWGDLVALPDQVAGTTIDFQNALTHELGHVIGLDHSCYATADGHPRLLDNNGVPEVDCYDNPTLPQSIAESTMYPSVSLTDTQRRDLAPDDQQGACDLYPYGHATCPTPDLEGGCSTAANMNSTQGGRVRLGALVTAGLLAGWLLLVCSARPRSRARRSW